MGAFLQEFVNKYIWNTTSKRSWTAGDDIYDTHGNIIHSFYTSDNTAGEIVTEQNALRNTTVYTCVNVRGNTLASLPCNVIQESDNKKTVLTDHHAYYLLHDQPNSYMTAANFWKTILLHVDIWGNGYAYINRDSRHNPVSLHIWEPWNVTVTFSEGEVWYAYNGADPEPSRDVLHYRFYSWDGICGRSPVLENRNTIGMAMKLDRYSSMLMGARPPGVLSYEGNLTPEQREQNKKIWAAGGAAEVKILSGRWKFDPILTPSEDSAFAVSRDINEQQLSGIWQIPPTFLQNFKRATFSNAEQMDLVYAKHTVSPICRNIELENNMKLFFEKEKKNTYTKFNMNGLLRGDLAARQAFYQSMVNTGVMFRNEARSLEDLNSYEGGDIPLIQGAMTPGDKEGIDALRKKMETEVIPSAGQKPTINSKTVNGNHYVN